ncbi:HTH-type transcriptional repressor Bm3R1 [Virgibacillus dokdonensis]|uniref:HTH-type transcriptional repressor Bm3R1 n=2 Tax=Virgibacillus dokdonensis TaxID=302167 RepID=A0A2K9IVX4_9BACI|nr:HTH-type transcriptional repressor Bm3R1 [Virgibacillus dokdonensis]
MDGFQRRREMKKVDILQAALHLFMEYGVQKVSIKEIASKADVSQVTIYNYFVSKDSLIDEVINYYIDRELANFEQLMNSNDTFPQKIKAVIFNKSQTAKQINDNFYQTIMEKYSRKDSSIQEVYSKKAVPMMMDFFEEGKRQGYIDQNISNEALFVYLQIFQEAFQRKEVFQQILPITEDITKLVFYGIAGNNG